MNKKLLPFALTALVAALAGCGGGGESANIIPTPNEEATTNGSCTPSGANCIEWGLEYPLDGLNFNCSSDTDNNFITLFDLNNGVATGSCLKTDKIDFSIQSFADHKINLGTIKVSDFAAVSTTTQLPRLSIIDLAKGITGRAPVELSPNDATVKVAMRLAKLWQVLALDSGRIVDPTDIQPLYITSQMRTALGKITKSTSPKDADFEETIKPLADLSKISDEQAFATVKKLVNIANAAMYQPEFSLFSTSGSGASNLSGSDGLSGCNKSTCTVTDKSTKHLFGHFMLITDRQGYTFGSGLQWRDTQLKLATSTATTLGGVNAELIRKVKPVQMTAYPQESWINPLQKQITVPYKFNVSDNSEPLELYQGKLFNDYVIAGKEAFYKLVTGKKEMTSSDYTDLGQWRFNADSESYSGSIDLYKIYPISYLDRRVFKTVDNVATRESYIFPMYANLLFKFTDTTVAPVNVGIVIDSNGNIRTNMQAANNLAMHQTQGCQGDVLGANLIDSNGVQQYRLGTLGRTFVSNKTVSVRMVFADPVFAKVNGALVGVDSRIETSANGQNSINIGGALLNLENVLASNVGDRGRVSFVNSADEGVKWANTYASFQQVYNATNTDETAADIELAKLSGGSVEFSLADCYRVKAK